MMLLRLSLQCLGLFDAHPSPSLKADGRAGRAWASCPGSPPAVDDLLSEANRLLEGSLTVFGHPVPMENGVPDWNRDPITGVVIPQTFGPAIDFRHLGHELEIKYLWEVNRHLWWATLAQAYSATQDRKYIDRLALLIDDWLASCPYQLGPNWSSPVEHGIRLINWSLVWHLIGGHAAEIFEGPDGENLRARWIDSVYKHIRFASDNYSFYSSADNHLIGEAAGVYVAAHTWDYWPEVRTLRARAKRLLEREIVRQFSRDGVNREQAFCYHKFSLEFLISCGLCGAANGDRFSSEFWARLESAILFVAAMTDCRGGVPSYGDSDDGEVFSLGYGPAHSPYLSLIAIGSKLFANGELSAKLERVIGCAGDTQTAWLKVPEMSGSSAGARGDGLPDRFEEGGYIILGDDLHGEDEVRLVMDVGPLGYNGIAGHGHADALSVTLSWRGEPLLIDAGTYCYNRESELRRYFRATSSHNTLTVDGCDQSVYGSSFLWLRDVNTRLRSSTDDGNTVTVEASHDGYRRLADPVVHARRVEFSRSAREAVIDDWLECRREHEVALHWHFAAGSVVTLDDRRARVETNGLGLHMELPAGMDHIEVVVGRESPPLGWASHSFYQLEPAATLVARGRVGNDHVLRTRLSLEERAGQR